MMPQLKNILSSIAALLTLCGAVLQFFHIALAPYLFAVGAAGIAVHFLTMSPKEMSLRKKRLHNMEIIASLLMIVASGLMFSNKKEWIICLLISAILLLYSAFVSDRPDKQEKQDKQ